MPGILCKYCKEPFFATRSDALYCSVTCRVRAHRARIRATKWTAGKMPGDGQLLPALVDHQASRKLLEQLNGFDDYELRSWVKVATRLFGQGRPFRKASADAATWVLGHRPPEWRRALVAGHGSTARADHSSPNMDSVAALL